MRRCPRLIAAAALLAIAFAGGCSKSTKTGEPTNTGVLTGYEMGNERDFEEGRRDRPGYRDFE